MNGHLKRSFKNFHQGIWYLVSVAVISASLRSFSFTVTAFKKCSSSSIYNTSQKKFIYTLQCYLTYCVEKRQKQLFFDGCSQPCSMKGPAGDAALTIKFEVPAGKRRSCRANYYVQCTLLTRTCLDWRDLKK